MIYEKQVINKKNYISNIFEPESELGHDEVIRGFEEIEKQTWIRLYQYRSSVG